MELKVTQRQYEAYESFKKSVRSIISCTDNQATSIFAYYVVGIKAAKYDEKTGSYKTSNAFLMTGLALTTALKMAQDLEAAEGIS